MPEIKHQFMGGKMDKDSDERLVPNGEYRDAMNIQVATSEGSDVGTAQNILGNEEVITYIPNANGVYDTNSPVFEWPAGAQVIGALSDEKIDTMYYFVWSQAADYILSWRRGNTSPEFVFVDVQKNILKFPGDKIITGINVIDNLLFWTDSVNEPRKINIQRCKEGTISNANVLLQTQLRNNMSGLMVPIEEEHITVIKKGPQVALDMELRPNRDPNKIYTAIIEVSPDATVDSSFVHALGSATPGVAIFPNPPGMHDFSALTTNDGSNEFAVRLGDGLNRYGFEVTLEAFNIAAGIPNIIGGPLEMLDGMGSGIGNNIATQFVGQKVVLQAYEDDGTPPGLPLTDFVIRGVITGVGNNSPIAGNPGPVPPANDGTNYFDKIIIKATTIDGNPPIAPLGANLKYIIDFFDETEKLFEFKYPRFSYRYKFEDGEYSTFAPFTQVAFAPGSFDYHPRKGYNIGMTNRLKEVYLYNAVTTETPDDVVAVEILFKDDASPNIYIVDTIKPDDYFPPGGINLWNSMKASSADVTLTPTPFVINKEAVSSVVPSNQLLRPWDNVPRKALAQDVTGNRVVYANYVQNYDLISLNGKKYVPDFSVGVIDGFGLGSSAVQFFWEGSALGDVYKSIKSLREYQLGVVFLDEFGRETPVLSNASGTVKVDKALASGANRFEVQFNSDDYPQALTHFKFFVKETSSEYYNMAMDRWYSAGDGNIWLAFPSSDRNKIDIDTFLILKKGSDQNTLVTEAARYKVLAIESEAPDFIKTTKRKAVVVSHNSTSVSTDLFGTATTTNAPLEGLSEFKMNYQVFFGTSGRDLADSEDELWIDFGLNISTEVSQRYKISSIAHDWDGLAANLTASHYSIQLDIPLGADVNFITDDPTGLAPTSILDGTVVNIYKYKVENLDRFDGRFFVKIYFDEVFRNNIDSTLIGGGFRVASSNKVFSMKSNMVTKHTDPNLGANGLAQRFLTRGKGQGITDPWMPYVGNPFSPSMMTDIPYGYYNIDDFTAHALYFRKYAVKDYDYQDTYGVPQNNTPVLGITPFPAIDNSLNSNNFQVLMHLQDTNGPGLDVVDYPNSHRGRYFKPATDFWKEFGYHTSTASTVHRKNLLTTSSAGNIGLTANWQKIFNQPIVGGESYWWAENDNVYASDEASARDNEVWFIDDGPFAGLISTWVDQSLWPLTNIPQPGFGNGMSFPNGASGSYNMQLAFGGITGASVGGVTPQGKTPPGFWEVGKWNPVNGGNSNYNDNATTDFVSRLKTGYKFRWKEDPLQTVYQVTGAATNSSRMRHSYGAVQQTYTDANTPILALVGAGIPAFTTTLSTVGVANTGAAIATGPKQNDLNSMAEKLSFNLTKDFHLKGIKQDDGAGIAWNPVDVAARITGGITLPLPAIIGPTGNTGDGPALLNDLTIYVGTLVGTDPLSSKIATLHAGMALKSFVNTAGATIEVSGIGGNQVNDFLVVRKINPLAAGGYELILGGYEWPLQQSEHTALVSGPGVGGNLTFVQVAMNGYSLNSEFNINTVGRDRGSGAIGAVSYTLEFLDEIQPTEVLSENPAIWETEPKDLTPLDIYYEACGSIPMSIDASNIADAFPIGTRMFQPLSPGIFMVVGYDEEAVIVEVDNVSGLATPVDGASGLGSMFFRPDDLIIKTDVQQVDVVIAGSKWKLFVEGQLTDNAFELPWHNCYSFGNGVESNRIRDTFNAPYISNGVKASTTLEQEYKEEHRKYGLIYSGIYNSISGINNLNQFIQAEKITKDINPKYGSIQKLYSRNSDLVTLCEDKILRIQANKDALFNADGDSNVVSTNKVLGQTIPFVGDYGISTNPESFAKDSYRAYFTDRVRGAVIRLSMDGLTPISDAGMKDWFRDNLKNHRELVGSFDDRNDEYNINLTNYDTVSVDGFIPGAFTMIGPNAPPITEWSPANDGIFILASAWAKIPNVSSITVGSVITFIDPKRGDLLVQQNTTVTSIDTGITLVSTFPGGGSTPDNYVKLGISSDIKYQTTGIPPAYPVYPNPDSGQGIEAGFMNFSKPVKFRITLSGREENKLVSFSEKVKGWVSFKSFANMQMGISLANDYYTFDRGNLYLHYSENQDRNTFYSVFTPSTLDVILNKQPGSVKVFNTLNYEGSQSKVDMFTSVTPTIPLQPATTYNDQEYYNLSDKPGWFVESITTNKEKGYVNEFLDKEGKWFNHINKNVNTKIKADTSDFTFQGLGFDAGCVDSPASGSGECISSGFTAAQGVVLPYIPWMEPEFEIVFGYLFANPSIEIDDVKWHAVGGQAGSCAVDSDDPSYVAGDTNYWVKIVNGTNQRWKTFNTHGDGPGNYVYGAGQLSFAAGQELSAIPVQSLFAANSFFYHGFEYIRFDTPSGNGYAYDVIDGMAALYNNNHGGNYTQGMSFSDFTTYHIQFQTSLAMTTWTNLGVSQPTLFSLQIMYDTSSWPQGAFQKPHMPFQQWGIDYVAGTPGNVGIICGCMDESDINYNPNATQDDGSCAGASNTYECIDGVCIDTGVGYLSLQDCDNNCGNTNVNGCTDGDAFNYDPTATVDDGSCCFVSGCTDSTANNYDPLACYDDGSCIAVVYGCTDPLALNYYAGADLDDGSCAYVAGCTDPAASNYDPLADYEDGSCTYGPVINSPCTGVINIPDVEFETGLINLGIDSGPNDGLVDNAAVCSLTFLSVGSYNISDLTGIEAFIALTQLWISNNLLTTFDVSNNTALDQLSCGGNQLTSLDVSANTALTVLWCFDNQLTTLDVSSNTALTQLACNNNQLTSLTLGTGIDLNNLNLDAWGNDPNLVIHVGTAGRVALAQSLFVPGGNPQSISPGTTFAI